MPRSTATRSSSEPIDARDAWHALLRVSSRVLRALDRALDAGHRISVNEFDVLITLGNRGDGGLRMTDLADAVMLSSGGLTRLVGRLEDRGLVRRTPGPGDARSFQATLTASGRAQLAAARRTHDAVIEDMLGSRLPGRHLTGLTHVLERVLEAPDPGAGPVASAAGRPRTRSAGTRRAS